MSNGIGIGKKACIDCTSSDGMELYKVENDDGTTTYNATCFAECSTGDDKGYKGHNRLAASYLGAELGIEKISRGRRKRASVDEKPTETKVSAKGKVKGAVITDKERDRIKDNTSKEGDNFRGISDATLKYFGVLTAFDEKTGEVTDRYYPNTETDKDENVELVGYHRRIVLPEKDFRAIGKNAKDCDMFGGWRCKGGKYILIAGGQEDAMAASQMLREDQIRRGHKEYPRVDVVSATVGETSCAAQAAHNYEMFDKYDIIVIDMDEDEAGRKAQQKLIDVLPPQKIRVMEKELKDANDYLDAGREREYVRMFYDAKKPKLAGVVSGMEMFDAMMDTVDLDLIRLPPALKPLEDLLCGGLPRAEIVNILAASGVGKTTVTNLLELFWIFEAPCKVGILSLEAGAGKFLLRLMSAYLRTNISRLKTKEEKRAFLLENKKKCTNLFVDEDGDERFCLVDDKGELDTLEAAKRVTERMIRQGGCGIIITDPLQDLLDALSVEDQAAYMGWQKKVKARDGVTFINVNHTRKSGGGNKAGSQGGMLTEEDMQGTSSIYKSGAVNIIITRDKTAEDKDQRNTTKVMVSKSRDAGETGPAGELFYEIETALLHNKQDWLKMHDRTFEE